MIGIVSMDIYCILVLLITHFLKKQSLLWTEVTDYLIPNIYIYTPNISTNINKQMYPCKRVHTASFSNNILRPFVFAFPQSMGHVFALVCSFETLVCVTLTNMSEKQREEFGQESSDIAPPPPMCSS